MIDLPRILVIGGGELGSAVAHRLRRVGFEVWIAEIDKPRCIRRLVCFGSACYQGSVEVEGIRGQVARDPDQAREIARLGDIPVVTADFRDLIEATGFEVIVDARMLKRRTDISKDLAPLVIGLGPGFVAGKDVDVVVETNRGHDLGRVIYEGEAERHTGEPAPVLGYTHQRVLRAPASGVFKAKVRIGDMVRKETTVGIVGECEVKAPIDGLVRGLVADGNRVDAGQKIGDIDPRGESIRPDTISDKGRAVAGGVLEAVMRWYWHDRQTS